MKTKDFYQIKPQNLISVLTIVVTALMLFATAPAFSQETIIYAEGFETDNGNYTKIIEPADPQFSMLTGDGLWQWGTPSWISDISMTSANGRFYVSSDGSNFTKLANFYMTHPYSHS